MPKGRPFLDSSGTIGKPKLVSGAQAKKNKNLQFSVREGYLCLNLDGRRVRLKREHAIALAYWIIQKL